MKARLLATALAACIATASCGIHHGPDFTIGLKRMALDLAYKDESKAPPPAAPIILPSQTVPALNGFVAPNNQLPSGFPPARALGDCPAAPPNSHPLEPVTVFVTKQPRPGLYTTHNTGTFSLGGALSVSGKYPTRLFFELKNVKQSTVPDPINGPTDVTTYDIVRHGVDGSTTTTTYQTTFAASGVVATVQQEASQAHAPQGELDIVKVVTTNADGTTSFTPSPPVTLMAFKNGPGTSWNSAGIDQATGTSMVVQGQITKRTNVDVCGQLFDTYEVVSNERIVNLQTGLSSQTDPQDPNVYDVATQEGALFVHSHIHTTTTYQTKSGTPLIININADEVVDSVSPAG